MSRSVRPTARTTFRRATRPSILVVFLVMMVPLQQVEGWEPAFVAVQEEATTKRRNNKLADGRGPSTPSASPTPSFARRLLFSSRLESSSRSNCGDGLDGDGNNDNKLSSIRDAQRETGAGLLFFASSSNSTVNNSKEPQEQQSPAASCTATASCTGFGRVVRVATRAHHAEHSQPSSRRYTTRKVSSQDSIRVTAGGCAGDYNHYRARALKHTPDRAVSLMTADALQLLRSHSYPVRDGDLGENVLVDGVAFDFFRIGEQYRFVNTASSSSSSCSGGDDDADESATTGVPVIEITEPMVPCGNLCKLPYINDDTLAPRERVQACRDFLSILGGQVGRRGWYAKVVQPGSIGPNAKVVRVTRGAAQIKLEQK